MSYKITLDDMWDNEYRTVLNDGNSKIFLTVSPFSFEGYLRDLFKEAPNDFRDVVHAYLIDCAFKYFKTHPISEEEKDRFFELLDELDEFDYEEEGGDDGEGE